MDVMLHCRKARVERGGVSSIPLLLQPIHCFSFPFFLSSILICHLDSLPKALYESTAPSLHKEHSAGIVNRRLQPENLTTISYAISSTHHNKVLSFGLHNPTQCPTLGSSHSQSPGLKATLPKNPTQQDPSGGFPAGCIGQPSLAGPRAFCGSAVFLALGYVEFQRKVL